jgi:hypothetical protein
MATNWWIGAVSSDPTVSGNWGTGSVPSSGDTVYLQAIPGTTIANGIGASDQHSIVLAALIYSPTFTQTVGTQTGYWQIGASVITCLPVPQGSVGGLVGSGRIKINVGSTSCAISVAATGQQSLDIGFEPTRFLGSAISSLNVTGGTVGLATSAPGETATVTTVNACSSSGTVTVNCGPGASWTTASAATGNAGACVLTMNKGGGTTANCGIGAILVLNGSTEITTVQTNGTVYHNVRTGSTDIGTCVVINGGIINISQNPAVTTFGTLTLGGTIVQDRAVPNQWSAGTLNLTGVGQVTAS